MCRTRLTLGNMSHVLFQRLYSLYRLSVVQPVPVLHQLPLMKCRPFENHRRRTIVVVEIHTNHDAEEAADLGHLPISYHVLSKRLSPPPPPAPQSRYPTACLT